MASSSLLNLRNLSIRWKLTGGFGLILLLTIIIGAFSYTGLNATVDRLTKADDANRMVKWLQEARIAEKNYIRREDDAEIPALNRAVEQTLSQAKQLRDKGFNDPQNIQLMNNLITQVTQYQPLSSATWTARGPGKRRLRNCVTGLVACLSRWMSCVSSWKKKSWSCSRMKAATRWFARTF